MGSSSVTGTQGPGCGLAAGFLWECMLAAAGCAAAWPDPGSGVRVTVPTPWGRHCCAPGHRLGAAGLVDLSRLARPHLPLGDCPVPGSALGVTWNGHPHPSPRQCYRQEQVLSSGTQGEDRSRASPLLGSAGMEKYSSPPCQLFFFPWEVSLNR